jgi:hypothetical protein
VLKSFSDIGASGVMFGVLCGAFSRFHKGDKKTGVFLAAVNQAPLRSKRKESLIQKFKRVKSFSGKAEVVYQ